jgi:hypothetical protein
MWNPNKNKCKFRQKEGELMKNKLVVTLMTVLVMTLLAATTVACSGTVEETEAVVIAAEETEVVAVGQGGGFADEVSPLNGLMAGLLLLEDSGQAVTAEQANEMLPLWKMARSLNESSNVATEELDALAAQISESLVGEQSDALGEMEISPEILGELREELGIVQGGSGVLAEGGELPEGAVPGSGAGGGAGGGTGSSTGLTPEQIATMQAERESSNSSKLDTRLLEVLIELLEEKVSE